MSRALVTSLELIVPAKAETSKRMSALRDAVTGSVAAAPATFATFTVVVVEVSSATGSVRARAESVVARTKRGRWRSFFIGPGWRTRQRPRKGGRGPLFK